MKRFGRLDGNQSGCVEDIRANGFSVFSTASIGNGFPDFVVGLMDVHGVRHCLLFELKDDAQPKSQQKLKPREHTFLTTWRGNAFICVNKAQVLDVCRAYADGTPFKVAHLSAAALAPTWPVKGQKEA